MLEFLQTGKALYVLAALCGVGVITRWLVRNLYKRLIKESDNMTLTRNKSLRVFKQKTETAYQINMGIPKVKPYLERQMYDFKYLGVSLHGWNTFSGQMTLWCFLAGGGLAFVSYWYRTDPYYIVLYGSAGIFTGLFTILVDQGAGVTEKRQQLFASLDNYLENTLIYRLDMEKGEMREILPAEMDTEQDKRAERRGARQRVRNGQQEKPLEKQVISRRKERLPEEAGTFSKNDADFLKHSLEQIAAGREKEKDSRPREDWLKELNPEELKLVGEILQEYLA